MPGLVSEIIESITPGIQSEVKNLVGSNISTEYSSIRRRLIENESRRIGREIERREGKLQVGRSRLSSSDIDLDSLKAAQRALRDEVTFVERQDDAARTERVYLNKQEPLQRAATIKRLVHRSDKSEVEAIAGFLERERSQRRKLSRRDFEGVKAKAAARFRYGLAKKFVKEGKFKPGIDRRPVHHKDLPKIAKELMECKLRHQVREILFAKFKHMGRIRLPRHLHGRSSFEAREQRRHVMHFVRCL